MACKNDRTQPFIPLLIGVRFIQPGEPERRGEHRARGIQGTRERPCSEISEFLGLQLRQFQTGERLRIYIYIPHRRRCAILLTRIDLFLKCEPISIIIFPL